MELGSSKDWSEVLEKLTGETEITSIAIWEFFQPLYEFLKNENLNRETAEMAEILKQYNIDASKHCTRLRLAEWAVTTDLQSEEKELNLIEAIQEYANFSKTHHTIYFRDVNLEDYTDENTRRQLLYLKNLGTDILSDTRLRELRDINSKMENIYNTAKICPFGNKNCDLELVGWSLNPGKYICII